MGWKGCVGNSFTSLNLTRAPVSPPAMRACTHPPWATYHTQSITLHSQLDRHIWMDTERFTPATGSAIHTLTHTHSHIRRYDSMLFSTSFLSVSRSWIFDVIFLSLGHFLIIIGWSTEFHWDTRIHMCGTLKTRRRYHYATFGGDGVRAGMMLISALPPLIFW